MTETELAEMWEEFDAIRRACVASWQQEEAARQPPAADELPVSVETP